MAAVKKKTEEAPVNEAVPVVEGNTFLEAIDGLDLPHVCEALKRNIQAAYLAGRDYERDQLQRLYNALWPRRKMS